MIASGQQELHVRFIAGVNDDNAKDIAITIRKKILTKSADGFVICSRDSLTMACMRFIVRLNITKQIQLSKA